MKELMDSIQPQLIQIIELIIGALVTLILGGLAMLQPKIKVWLATRATESQRNIIQKIAAEAYAYAEKEYKDQTSSSSLKLNAAFSYAAEVLGKAGIKITADEIKGAIEKAVQDYKKAS